MLAHLYDLYMMFAWSLLSAFSVIFAGLSMRIAYHIVFGNGELNIPLGFVTLQINVKRNRHKG